MANACVICGKTLGRFEGVALSSRLEHGALKICPTCFRHKDDMLSIKDVDDNAAYFSAFVDQVQDPVVRDYLIYLADTPTREAEKINRRAEIDEQERIESIEKNKAEIMETLDQFGIDFDSYDDGELRKRNAFDCREIARSLSGEKWTTMLSSLTMDSDAYNSFHMARTQIKQNWILMRQNEEIIRLLQKIAEK
jgi:arginyl-tRNA synthetase